jgi:glycerol-3-phosphate dehydrogenase
MVNQFSAFNRPAILSLLQTEHFDLLIIGGGITGAGIALDAASRGLKVALVEKNDFAYGTSSRSTKLIHGGLRYLKQLEFGLVKEVGSERAVVHKLAPHLVLPEKMLLPLSEKKGLGYWLTSIGLRIYDFLAGVKPEDQRKMLTRVQTLKHEPLLRKDDIKGGAIYAEYRTDDARLTIEIIKKAFQFGAVITSYCLTEDFVYAEGIISGVRVRDVVSDTAFTIKSTVVVNATGPWVDELRERNKSKKGKKLHLTKGVHIVLPHEKLPVQQAIYFDADDGRMIFAIPRGVVTYVGTTDTTYEGDKDHVLTLPEDAAYLVQAINITFPTAGISVNDIESSWAGLRPLIHEEGKSASELSRKDEIFESPTGLISIAGGKLTGYRKMAERVVDLVSENYFSGKALKACYTKHIKLFGAEFGNAKDVNRYITTIEERLRLLNISDHFGRYLVYNYGKQTDWLIENIANYPDPDRDQALIKTELDFTINQEMVLTPLDFFVRRTGMLYFDRRRLEKYSAVALDLFQKHFAWSDTVLNQQKQDLSLALNECLKFKNK